MVLSVNIAAGMLCVRYPTLTVMPTIESKPTMVSYSACDNLMLVLSRVENLLDANTERILTAGLLLPGQHVPKLFGRPGAQLRPNPPVFTHAHEGRIHAGIMTEDNLRCQVLNTAMERIRTLSAGDPNRFVVRSSLGTFLNELDQFGSIGTAKLFPKDMAFVARTRVYRAMVHYLALNIVDLSDSEYRKFFYAE